MNAIKECLKTAVTQITPQEVATLQRRIVKIDGQLNDLGVRRTGLLGVEAHASHEIERRMAALRREKVKVTDMAQTGEYPRMDLDALTWRAKDGWPRIALLALHTPGVTFMITRRSDGWGYMRYKKQMMPRLESKLWDCYKDVFAKLTEMAKEEKKSICLTTEFAGVIPQATKQKIAQAYPKFRSVYIAAEAKKWQVKRKPTEVVRPQFSDPLVLGWDGRSLWVIDHFDMTPVEQYLKDEFCV